MARSPYSPLRSAAPPRKAAHREALVIALTLAVVLAAVGGGYLLASHVPLRFGLPSVGSPPAPTPISTLAPIDAVARIHQLYPGASISLRSPSITETDLLTSENQGGIVGVTSTQATGILELYLRAFPNQSQWRWIDVNQATQITTTYQVNATELWVISASGKPCMFIWTIYELTPDQIIFRGATGQAFDDLGVPSRPGEGTPPPNAQHC